jgi:peptidoglycan/LPS O-acetylase OafA/YrhL
MHEKTFRYDIQSLRAISVILVIFYHFNFSYQDLPLFSGGFIGVDIFFIISGYVISNLILIELKQKNDFKFSKFIEKRLRRLVPALYFFLFIIFCFGLIFLLPSYLSQLSFDIIFNVLLSSNFYFWDSLQAYGAVLGIDRPLLHTWSLSVEWQFYIFTSILFIFFKNQIMKNFNMCFLVLFFMSIFLNFFILSNQINFNFYFSGSRYWEFILGILIRYNESFLTLKVKNILNEKKINFFLFFSIFFIIFFSISYELLENKKTFFIISMFLSSFIILMGNTDTVFLKLFKTNSLVFIGAISYSLYVWHYPFASFFFATENQIYLTNSIKIILLVPLLLISIFSYKYIEVIFRKSDLISTKKFYIYFTLASFMLLFISYISIKNDGYINRVKISQDQKNFIIEFNKDRVAPIDQKIEINNSKKNILVLGNSIGGEFFEILNSNDYFKKRYNIIYSLIQIRCLENLVEGKTKSNCFRKLEFKKENDYQNKISYLDDVDIVILKTRWSKKDIKDLPKVINFLKKKKKKVIIISANPEFSIIEKKQFKPIKKYENYFLINALFQLNTIADKYYLKNYKLPEGKDLLEMEKKYFSKINWKKLNNINKSLKDISLKYDVAYVDDLGTYCEISKNSCEVIFEGKKIHWDNRGHATILSKPFLSKRFLEYSNIKDHL